MPRGIPNKKPITASTDTVEKKLDINNSLDNLASSAAVEPDDLLNTATVKVDDAEYTTSPDGKYKIPKPKPRKHAEFLENKTYRIPYITDPDILAEWHVYWVTDEKPHSIQAMIKDGYSFVDTNVKGCESAVPTHSGYRADGSAFMSYAMWMPLATHKEIQALRQDAILKQEQQNELEPSSSKGIYATNQMKLGRE